MPEGTMLEFPFLPTLLGQAGGQWESLGDRADPACGHCALSFNQHPHHRPIVTAAP